MRDSPPDEPAGILVAEDNPVNQRLAVAMLAKLGYRAEVVGDGAGAMEALTRSSYDAVLMDCEMPRMDGYQATTEIRRREEAAGRRTPIIAMTAAALEGDRERCLAAGMDDYISKPVDMRELARVVDKWIGASPGVGEPQPATTPSGNGSIDPRRAAELRGLEREGGGTALSELSAIFLRDTAPALASIQTAMRDGDAAALEAAAHYLRGAAANIGALRMRALCHDLERAGESGDLTGVSDVVDRLTAELGRVHDALSDEIEA